MFRGFSFIFLACLLVAGALVAEAPTSTGDLASPLEEGGFPQSLTYDGQVVDVDGRPLGAILDEVGQPLATYHPMRFRYLDLEGNELLVEDMDAVEVLEGRFQVELGTGLSAESSRYDSLAAVFAKHPELELEVGIDGQTFEPRLAIIPAGHSVKSRLVAAGQRQEDDDQDHWKNYAVTGGASAIQAGILAPEGAIEQPPLREGTVRRRPFTLPMVGPMLSRSVRDLPKAIQQPMLEDAREINKPRHEKLFDSEGRRFGTATTKVDDYLAIPSMDLSAAAAAPAVIMTFEGVGNVTGVLPPDTEGAVGPNHYVHVVNSSFAVFDKSGNQLTSTANTNTLWAGYGGPCQNDNSGDAIFLYDQEADRFVLTQFAVSGSNQSVCFAISQTPDPTASYYLYEVVAPRFPDYYKVGIWSAGNNNAFFMGTNSGSQGQYDVFAVDRANMLVGNTARPMQFFQNFVNLMMPADVDGPVGPAANSPGIFYTFRDGGEAYFSNPATDSLDVYEFDVDWNTPSSSTYTLAKSITPAQGLADFNWTVCGFFVSNCIPQPGTSQGIDSASWWPMQRLVYRNFGSHETLIGAWTVDVNVTGNRAAPRWFELRNTGGGYSLYQQGTHSPDAIHRWMPSIAMDGSGNIAIGYSRGDGSNFPSIYYATRAAADPLDTLGTEAIMYAGNGSQTHSAARWGDYSSMELDPSDDCTFWYTTEYLSSTSSSNWRTRVGTFKMPGCGGPVNNPPVVTITAPANGSTFDVGTAVSFSGTASDTEDGDLTASLSWTSSVDGSIGSGASFNTSTLSIGTHLITASATDSGSVQGNDSITVTISDPNNNGPQNAVYNGGLGAPACSVAGSSCDSLSLLDGRSSVGPEPNQPNTLGTCADGSSGTYHSDESNDKIVVSTLDGADFAEGATVVIDVTVWAWSTGSADTLDLYYAANANSPTWAYLTSLSPAAGGAQTLSANYALPAGSLQAVRANFRYNGSTSSCSGGSYDDTDDLVFAVGGGNNAPTVSISSPTNGASFNEGQAVSFSGSASDTEDGDLSSSLSWSSSLDGAIGSGATFSTSALSAGSHTITASVTDSGSKSGSDSIGITINVVNTAPTVTISSPTNGASFNEGQAVSFSGSASDTEDGDLSASLSWSSSLDGAIGSGATFSTSTLSAGTHTITASVTDSGGLSDSAVIGITVNVVVNTAPSVAISTPTGGSSFDVGTSVSFLGSASDAEDGDLTSTLTWSSSLDGSIGSGGSFSSTTLTVGSHTITAAVVDSGGLSGSDVITITINSTGGSNGPQTAAYDAGLGAPACAVAGSSCDSVALLDGRSSLGPEPNQPNTVDACTDGSSGTYHSDESFDRLVVSTLDGSDMVEGATVNIAATVWAWSTGSSDTLDLYYAANANSPSWVYITSLSPPAGGAQTLNATYVLPTGSLQAVRGNFRYNGSQSSCSTGSYDDDDDLVFAVGSGGGGGGGPTALDLSSYTWTGYGGQDTTGGAVAVEGGGTTYYLEGNRWRRTQETFNITSNTVVEFDFWSGAEGEIHGMGFDENDGLSSTRMFKLHGTQNWGISTYDNYPGGGAWVTYTIPVGQSYSGSAMYLVFVNDKDSGTGNNTSRFRNVKIYEP